jgi:capsular polysaccharide biosynthesis protein
VTDPPTSSSRDPVSGLAGFSALLKRWRWMLIAATLAAAIAGWVIASGDPPEYEAHVTLLVGPIGGETDTIRAAGQLVETYAALATSRPQLDATAERLKLRDVSAGMSTSASSTTRLLTIRVRQRNPILAARIANAHAETLMQLAATHRGVGSGRLTVVDPAVASATPAGPAAPAVALFAGVAGLLGALALALLLDRSGGTVKDAGELEAVTGVACVGSLSRPALRGGADRPVVERAPRSRAAGEYRLLAAKLDASGRRSLLIIALDGDGQVMAANLAAALAAGGSDVALVDVAGRLAGDGAADAASNGGPAPGDHNGNGNGHQAGGSGAVRVLSHPIVGRNRSRTAEAALLDLEGDADVVVLHAPALQRSPRALAWARAADGTLLVAQRDRTVSRDLRATVETLHLVRANLLGTVLAEPPPPLQR